MIEQGRLILTMMPSLYCKLDCPHCYLTKAQRRSKDCLSLEQVKTTVEKINNYYQSKNIHNASIEIYWYGGEPTTMGVELFSAMCDIINSTFKHHQVKHTLLSALVGVNLDDWTPIIKQYCHSKLQTSYDGLMRGKRYDEAWQKQVLYAHSIGLRVNTLSVFNKTIEKDDYEKTLIKLSELGIRECGWLPFQKNIRNDATGMYDKYATTMNEFSNFMIGFTQLNDSINAQGGASNYYPESQASYSKGKTSHSENEASNFESQAFHFKGRVFNSENETSHSKGEASNSEGKDSHFENKVSNSNLKGKTSNSNFKSKTPFLIGNELFINSMHINGSSLSNTGAQTVFLMPNGNMVMPDYDSNNIEFMKVFGNSLTQSFEQILTSPSRRDWLRRQMNRNNNKECLECNNWNCCLMEFWKNNNQGDDCYGAKRYVEWLCSTGNKRFLFDDATVETIENTQAIRVHTAIEHIA